MTRFLYESAKFGKMSRNTKFVFRQFSVKFVGVVQSGCMQCVSGVYTVGVKCLRSGCRVLCAVGVWSGYSPLGVVCCGCAWWDVECCMQWVDVVGVGCCMWWVLSVVRGGCWA